MRMQQTQIMVPPTNVKIVFGYIEGSLSSAGIELNDVRFVVSRLPFIGIEKKVEALQTLRTFADRLELVGINVENKDELITVVTKAEQTLKEWKQNKS